MVAAVVEGGQCNKALFVTNTRGPCRLVVVCSGLAQSRQCRSIGVGTVLPRQVSTRADRGGRHYDAQASESEPSNENACQGGQTGPGTLVSMVSLVRSMVHV
jgi:hypothetical protein